VVRLGTQGWSYPDWIGVFYPPASKQEHYLPFYGRVFDTVELDTTFYHPPKPSIVRSWARHTPEGFRFSAKVPQRITHEAKLTKINEHMTEFVRALDPLGDKRGPLLVQMPAEFQRDPGTEGVLDRFLAACPSEAKIAVEFRHASWHDEAIYDLMRRRRAAIAWTEWRDLPRVSAVTADFLYLRWLGAETLLEAPEAEVRRLCDFVGIDFDPAMFRIEPDTTYERPDASLTYPWRRRLDERSVRLVEAVVGPLLETYGYEPSGLAPLELTAADERRLVRDHRMRRFRAGLKAYGWLQVGRAIASRLPARGLERRLQRRIDDITTARLK
jgi:uncharacterized protein YecE (DUF72 family)